MMADFTICVSKETNVIAASVNCGKAIEFVKEQLSYKKILLLNSKQQYNKPS